MLPNSGSIAISSRSGRHRPSAPGDLNGWNAHDVSSVIGTDQPGSLTYGADGSNAS
jgi:hypothetical protein